MAIPHKFPCHCEERSDVAIPLGFLFSSDQGIPTAPTGPRNDSKFCKQQFICPNPKLPIVQSAFFCYNNKKCYYIGCVFCEIRSLECIES